MMISIDESDFMFTNAAWMIPSASGSLSAASSILIMSIILRSSPESRASAYHIIMFFMSFWDFITSIAVACTTIPMPSDVHEIYPFAGKAYGNVRTCEAQGFLIVIGTILTAGSISILMVHYVCTIRYGMAAERFKRRMLPIMLAILMTLSTIPPTAALKLEYFNPQPSFNTCSLAVNYPIGCNREPEKCIRGGRSDKTNTFVLFGMTFFGSVFLILVSSLVLVLKTIFDTEMAIRRRRRNDHLANDHVNFNRTRAVLIEALMYFTAFVLTWVWLVITLVKKVRSRDPLQRPKESMMILLCLFQPLQGFLNALVFIYQKAYALREIHEELNLFQAFVRVIVSPSSLPEVTVMVSNLHFLELNHHQPTMENTNAIISPSLISMSSDFDSISQNIPDNESATEQSADFLPNNNGSNGLTTTGIQSASHTTPNSQTLFPLAPLNETSSSSSSLHDDMTAEGADSRPTSTSNSNSQGRGTSTTWSCGGHTTLPDIQEECDDHSGGSLFAHDTI